MITYADTENEIDKLIKALKNLSNKNIHKRSKTKIENKFQLYSNLSLMSTPDLTPREAFYSQTTEVQLHDAINKICAEEVTFYPPGIPLIYPGEMITADIIDIIETNKKIGRSLIGAANTNLDTIKILDTL